MVNACKFARMFTTLKFLLRAMFTHESSLDHSSFKWGRRLIRNACHWYKSVETEAQDSLTACPSSHSYGSSVLWIGPMSTLETSFHSSMISAAHLCFQIFYSLLINRPYACVSLRGYTHTSADACRDHSHQIQWRESYRWPLMTWCECLDKNWSSAREVYSSNYWAISLHLLHTPHAHKPWL